MNNIDIAHEYFYNYMDRYYYPRYKSLGYDHERFYSYNTLIGKICTDANNNPVLLISQNNFSVTTGKHLNYLWRACPFKTISVNLKYGGRDITPQEAANRALEDCKFYSNQKLTQKANREGFLTALATFNDLNATFALKIKAPKTFIKLADVLNNSESVKALKIRAAEIARKAAEAARRKLNRLLKGRTLAELAQAAYSYESELDADQRAEIRKVLNPSNDLSFVWRDKNGDFKTSQHITINAEEGNKALRAYKAGLVKHGDKIGYYTVLAITSEFVKIGCHKIPVKNLMELMEG